MVAIPVDVTAAMVMVAMPPVPKVKDKRTGEIAVDHETGVPLVNVTVNFVFDGAVELLTVAVPETGIADDLLPGAMVAMTGMVARSWEMEFNGRKTHGVSFRAVAVTALAPAGKQG
ncbi:SCO3933 family regulatory protein [Yinghuangia soli]|uniref:Regulatory protein n=1 Tax=Yinghuangia soli TaxID=2908204 RepID=A0AA41Q4C6_9ACTN|nr:hypothetical protein [Yinghuangia soli]MCF2531318.1 hypothetical protein [Yinghuangia soli]